MKIGILKTGKVPEPLVEAHGDYPAMFERLLDGNGFTFATYSVRDMEFPSGVHDCDGWLITGSADGAYEDHAYIRPLEDFIREVYNAGVPIAGICFGHQVMAKALGGKVVKYDGGWGLGHTEYSTVEGAAELLALHQDQVIEKPSDAEVIASTDFCANAGLAYNGPKGRTAISFQPHPEFTPEYMRDLLRYKVGRGLTEEEATRAIEAVQEENDSARIADQLARFFRDMRAAKAA